MGGHQVGIEAQRTLKFRDGRAIFAILEVSIAEIGVADGGVRLQLRNFAELLNRHADSALLPRRRPGLRVFDDFRRKTLQEKATGKERSHGLPEIRIEPVQLVPLSDSRIISLRNRVFGIFGLCSISVARAITSLSKPRAVAPASTSLARHRDSDCEPVQEPAARPYRLPAHAAWRRAEI